MPTPPVPPEFALKLAVLGKCQCRVCRRIGPMNGALLVWWAGVPTIAVCMECFGPGRSVMAERTADGVGVGLSDSGDRTVVAASSIPSSADLSQTKVSRMPSNGWAGSGNVVR